MQHLLLKEFPTYENLVERSKANPSIDPSKLYSCLHVLKAGDDIFRGLATTFRKRDISHGRSMVMFALMGYCRENKEKTPAEIAGLLCITRATVTGLLDGLEKDGLIERKPNPNDRRGVLVKLTDAGIRLVEDIVPEHHSMINSLMEGLDEEERAQLTQLLSKLCAHIAQTMPEVTPCEQGK